MEMHSRWSDKIWKKVWKVELLAYRFYLKPKGKNLFNGMFFGTDNIET